MQDDAFATRREFDMLANRVENLDHGGTRGVVALQAQLTDTIKDIAELKLDMSNLKTETSHWFVSHAKQHDEDRKERARAAEIERREKIVTRRWIVGTILAVLLAIGGLYPYLASVTHH